ncbi:hypothetical protein PBC6_039 [Bacillus phage PBC6]|nr:hypothetical protein PBC6_039 [Bacillus phage PBC6]
MDYIKCGEKELNTAAGLLTSLKFYLAETTDESDIYHNLEVTNEHDLNGLKYDLENHPILEQWLEFSAGKKQVIAHDAVNGTGFQVIDIADDGKVFGYVEEDGEKVFFISETKDHEEEETGENNPYFFIYDTPVHLGDCLRNNL